jgi:hypothetical protein
MTANKTGILAAQSVGAEPGSVKTTSQIALINTGQEPPLRADYTVANVPIPAGENSYEAFLKLPIDPDLLTVSGIKLYLTSALPTGVVLKYKSDWTGGTSAYSTPVKSTSGKAVTTIPVSLPAAANVSIDGALATTKTIPFLTDYIILQLQTTTSAATGVGSLTLYVQYVDNTANTYTGTLPVNYYISPSNAGSIFYNIVGIFNDFIDITGVFPSEASDGLY